MTKYFAILFVIISFNCFSYEYIIERKIHSNEVFLKLKEYKKNIINVQNLDQEIDGNIMIIFE